MPRKVREIKADLRALGFVNRGGKGDHTNWVYPQYPALIVGIAGKDGADCKHYDGKPYNEADLRRVRAALADLEKEEQD